QAAIEARVKEAEALRGRVQTCDEANAFFKTMQNAAIRESVTKTSADIPAVLREVLEKTPIGHLTPPEATKQGGERVALCGRKTTTVDTPKKKEIREKMYAEKYEAKSKSYLQEVRKAAMIEYRDVSSSDDLRPTPSKQEKRRPRLCADPSRPGPKRRRSSSRCKARP